jgi:hypothetical protein|tara:strand:- start:821 stop:1333 length:513 start_codon:yes stop_codon:yes gene_type:complete
MVLAELSMAIAAVKGVGELIDSAKSVAEVASSLDSALNLSDKAKKKEAAKPKGKTETRINKQLEKFEDNTDGESTNLGAIVQEVTDAKALKIELWRLGVKLDVKWGEGTWDKILEIRRKRLEKQERLEYEHQQRILATKRQRKEFWLEVGKGILLVLVLSGFIYWLLQYY